MLNEHPYDPLDGLIVKNGKLVVSKKKQKEIEKENMLYKNIPPPKFLFPHNHTKLIIPFYDEEKLNTAYTRIGTAIGSNKFK